MKKKGSIYISGLEDYINQSLVLRPDPIFSKVESYAAIEKIPVLSPSSGDVLSRLVEWQRPKSILELGTGAGISLFWMVSRLHESVRLTTVDRNRNLVPLVKQFWAESTYAKRHRVEFRSGFIVEQLLDGSIEPLDYDFVFVDCDKVTYPQILDILTGNEPTLVRREKVLDVNLPENLECKLNGKPNGKRVAVFDNVLWHGRILNPDPDKPSDQAMIQFWSRLQELQHPRTLFPVGDGLLLVELDW